MTADKTPTTAPDTAETTSEQEELLMKAMADSVKLEPVEFTAETMTTPSMPEREKDMVEKMRDYIERPTAAPQSSIFQDDEPVISRGSLDRRYMLPCHGPLFRDDELELLYQYYNRCITARDISPAPLGSLQRSLWLKFLNPYNLYRAIGELIPYIQRRQYQDWRWFVTEQKFDEKMAEFANSTASGTGVTTEHTFDERGPDLKSDGLVPEITIELVDQPTDPTDPTDPSPESPEE